MGMVLVLITWGASGVGKIPQVVNDGIFHGDPPFLLEEGWTPLLNGRDLGGWQYRFPERGGWGATPGVYWVGSENPRQLLGMAGAGDRILNTVTDFKPTPSDIYTTAKFKDLELYVEFLVPEGSNSGVYVHGLYEVQITDSFEKDQVSVTGICGTIYDFALKVNDEYVGGVGPLVRAERPAGHWQSFHIWFQAPRFDAEGKKISPAKFLRVLHNGILIHENVERKGPTRAAMDIAEASENPIMLQGDHGPIAFRNMYIRPLRPLSR